MKTTIEASPITVRVLKRRVGGYELYQGFAAEERVARLARPCAVCQRDILPGEKHYAVTPCAGLGAMKFPARVHQNEIETYFKCLERRYNSMWEVEDV